MNMIKRLLLIIVISAILTVTTSYAQSIVDTDRDGIGDEADICVRVRDFSTLQPDSNSDGLGDSCASPLFNANQNPESLQNLRDFALSIGPRTEIGGNVRFFAPFIIGEDVRIVGSTLFQAADRRTNVIGNGVIISGARLQQVILRSNVRVFSGADVSYAILGEGVVVQSGARIDGRSINRRGDIILGARTIVYKDAIVTGSDVVVGEDVLFRSSVNIQGSDVIIGNRAVSYTHLTLPTKA